MSLLPILLGACLLLSFGAKGTSPPKPQSERLSYYQATIRAADSQAQALSQYSDSISALLHDNGSFSLPGCPKPFVNVMSECFVLSMMELSWGESRHLCRWMGGDLATPKNLIAVREYFMQELFNAQAGIWVGATDEDNPGVWNWLNGKPIEHELWGPIEPDGGNHHCLSVYMNTTWYPPLYDHPCSTPRRPLCQYHY